MTTANNSTTDTRTPAEKRYDAERDGTLYTAAGDDGQLADDEATDKELAPIPPLEGFDTDHPFLYDTINDTYLAIDRRDGEMLIHTTGDDGQTVILKPAQVIALYRFFRHKPVETVLLYAMRAHLLASPNADVHALFSLIDQHLPMPPLPPAGNARVYTERLYHDPAEEDDLTKEPHGPPAYVSYCAGEGDAKAEVSFQAQHAHAPEVFLFRRDAVSLEEVLAVLPNLLTLLNSSEVKAAEVAYRANAIELMPDPADRLVALALSSGIDLGIVEDMLTAEIARRGI